MVTQPWKWRIGALAALAFITLLAVIPGDADGSLQRERFQRFDPATDSPTGHNVIEHCNPADAENPDSWPRASAAFTLNERPGRSEMRFVVRNAKPDTYFTLWLRLRGVDSEGNVYSGNPLTGIPGTPLVPSWELPNQLAITPPHAGSNQQIHGFHTNQNGYGKLTLSVDFPITSGAYPFHRFPDFDQHKTDVALTNDENLGRLGGQPASIKPVAIQDGSQAPFTIRIASHCVDGVVHGLLPGPHENWFDWTVE